MANFGPGNLFNGGFHIGAFALSGTAAGFDAGISNNGTGSNGTSATITVAQAGSFVVAVNSYGTNTATGMTALGSNNLSRAYQSNVGAGSFTADFGGGNVTSVASFSVIPEPSSFGLIGLTGALLLIRRRR